MIKSSYGTEKSLDIAKKKVNPSARYVKASKDSKLGNSDEEKSVVLEESQPP